VKRLEIQSFGEPTEELRLFFKACGFEMAKVGLFRLI
jgi:hypothetical protein